MNHPDPQHDAENERDDDDLLRQEDDARRREDEQAVRAESRPCACTPLTKYADACESCRRAFDESVRIAAYANQRRIPIEARYDSRGDPGVDGSFGYSERIYNAQIRANREYSQRSKERK